MNDRIKGVTVYLLIAFAIAWINLGIASRLGLGQGTGLVRLATLPAAFAPAIAAFVVRKWVTREGFADAGLALNLRKKWPYYLLAWFFPGIVLLVTFALAAALGARLPSPIPPGIVLALPGLPVQLILGALAGTPKAWGEEFGWRGYLQIRLLADRPLLAAVVTGLVWAAWHYALNLGAYTYPGQDFSMLFLFAASTILGSIILGWLRVRTSSVWAAALYHSAFNTSNGSATVSSMLFAMTGRGRNWLAVLWVLPLVAMGTLCIWIVLSGQLQMHGVQKEGQS